jgi:type II restriction/modification system DNA methylase subunit YeeA
MPSPIDLDEVAREVLEAASKSVTEEDLKINIEYVIRSRVIERLREAGKPDIPVASWRPPRASYDVTLVSGVRPDALYGHLIIEYKRPRTFESRREFERAVEQLKNYIIAHAQTEARYPRYFGIVLDGYQIGFVRYREALRNFESKGPFPVNRNTIAKLVEAIIGLRRKALSPEELLRDFGPESPVAKDSIRVFYNKLLNPSPKTKILFDDWRRVFSQVCAYSPEKIKGLEKIYGFEKVNVDPEKLLFALHTYYALIMKLLAAEVASLYMAPRLLSYLKTLEDAYYREHETLRDELQRLEEGGIFATLGIINFMEADYFAWYLDEWDENVAKCVMSIVSVLSNYDPTTAELEPERVRDLFKRLYQNLVPKEVRHDLGEYYTPDWLAELVLNEVGWTVENFEKIAEEKNDKLAPLDLRLLDPACGSGTFLVLAIGRLRNYIEEHWIDKRTALRRITKNIVGFDLNPLAVIASRVNYLIALGDLLRERGGEPIEIPIYLSDSILVETTPTLTGGVYILRTAAGKFQVPASIIERGFLAKTLKLIEECARTGYTVDEFRMRLSKELNLNEEEVEMIADLFRILSNLEKEGKNRIWTRIIKNSFAPFFTGRFDYVVGNPPWINWENLPEEYREATKDLWGAYGLLKKTEGVGLGRVKRDMAMLFLARCLDRYVNDGGLLSFLIPFTAYKTQAGAGFRKYLTRHKVIKVHDLVTLYPFEGATNRTSLIVVKKEERTSFPIPCIIWCNPTTKPIDVNSTLEKVITSTRQHKLFMIPVEINKPESPWMQMTEKAYEGTKKVIGSSPWYKAHAGVYTGLNQVYWIEIISETPEGLLITNPSLPGQKKIVKTVKHVVEKDLIYPLVRGRDVKKWYITRELGYILLPVDEKGETLTHEKMKLNYPKTWSYLINFVQDLVRRGGEPYKSKLAPYRKERFEKAEKIAPPFYWLFNVSPSLAPYKVIWKYIAGKISGKAEFSTAVLEPVEDKLLGIKTVIPNEKLMLIPFLNRDEAYYVSAILNSSLSQLLVASYVIETAISTHILERIKILKFNPNSSSHLKLSELSKKAHEIAKRIYEEGREDLKEDLSKIEEEIDKTVAQLYDITDDELREIKRCLAILKCEEVEEEEIEESPEVLPDIFVENPVLYSDSPQDIELAIVNPYEESLRDVKIKLELDDKAFEEIFEELSGEQRLKISLGRLSLGEYKIKISMEYRLGDSVKRVEKEVPLYVRSSEVRFVERGGLDSILGEEA